MMKRPLNKVSIICLIAPFSLSQPVASRSVNIRLIYCGRWIKLYASHPQMQSVGDKRSCINCKNPRYYKGHNFSQTKIWAWISVINYTDISLVVMCYIIWNRTVPELVNLLWLLPHIFRFLVPLSRWTKWNYAIHFAILRNVYIL